jgi:hypothetical protein
MPEPEFSRLFISKLNRIGVNYFITGSIASTLYGEPRLTHDIDLVISLDHRDIEKIIKAFPEDEYYCPPKDIMHIELNRTSRGAFNLIHRPTGYKADVYLMGENALHHWAMVNKRSFEVERETLWVAPPEYVILRKLEFYREGGSDKHLRDIAGMLANSSDVIDFSFLSVQIKTLGLEREWEKAKVII